MFIRKQVVRNFYLCLARILALFFVAASMVAAAQTPIWSEEFDFGSAPDDKVWSYDIGTGKNGWGNSELQRYTSDLTNVRIADGNLIITAVKEGNSFTSARVKTQDKLTFKYGTIEARIQTPDLGDGLWPAFWTLGNDHSSIGWPECGEIDIMEMGSSSAIAAGEVNQKMGTHLHWDDNGSYQNYGFSYTSPTNQNGSYHVYRMEWTPDRIKTYIDGELLFIRNISAIPEFNAPHFFVLNLAVGGTYTGINNASGISAPFPAEYVIDYIRIFDNGHTVLGGTSTVEPPAPGVNLLKNPGFESGMEDWSQSLGGGSASASVSYAHQGGHSLMIDSTGAGDWASPNASQSFSAKPGDIYAMKGYMLNPASSPVTGGSFGLFKVEFRDGEGAVLEPASVEIGISAGAPFYGAESTPKLDSGSATATWIFSETQAEAPEGTEMVGFYVLNVNQPGNLGPMYFDDIEAVLMGDPVLPFFLSYSIVGENIQISFPTQDGVSYQMAYRSSVTNENWTPIETIAGNGATNSVTYPTVSLSRFYTVLIP